MNLHEKLKKADIDESAEVVLSYSAGGDVVHAWDGFEQEVMNETGIAQSIAELITEPRFKNDIIEEMRRNGDLDNYARDGSGFSEYVAALIEDDAWEYEWIEQETERYDYKRGYHTVTANIETTVGNIMKSPSFLFAGWSAQVQTGHGRLVVD